MDWPICLSRLGVAGLAPPVLKILGSKKNGTISIAFTSENRGATDLAVNQFSPSWTQPAFPWRKTANTRAIEPRRAQSVAFSLCSVPDISENLQIGHRRSQRSST